MTEKNNSNLVVVYWSKDLDAPVYHFANENVSDINEFANIVIPKDVHYNVIEKKDVNNLAVPGMTNKILKNDTYNLYYEYLNAL